MIRTVRIPAIMLAVGIIRLVAASVDVLPIVEVAVGVSAAAVHVSSRLIVATGVGFSSSAHNGAAKQPVTMGSSPHETEIRTIGSGVGFHPIETETAAA